jgi:hypothetical protein
VKINFSRTPGLLGVLLLATVSAIAQNRKDVFVLTSTNDATANHIVVFRLDATGTPSLNLVNVFSTGGKGGASGNAGSVQFRGNFGAVANYGSNSVTRLQREDHSVRVAGTIALAPDCVQPDSVALSDHYAFVVGQNCAESHAWPAGNLAGSVVPLSDNSAAQIVAGETWAAITLKSGSVLQLPLSRNGALTGASSSITLPPDADDTPLGEAFWGNILGFNPAHSPDSFALINDAGEVSPVLGPQPPYPTNAPCWLAKGPGNAWYSGNSPAHAISIFFSDAQGGTFYKSVPLPGVPTDVSVSADQKRLAVIYTASDGSGARIATFHIDPYGDLSPAAISNPVGIASFNGVAISQ